MHRCHISPRDVRPGLRYDGNRSGAVIYASNSVRSCRCGNRRVIVNPDAAGDIRIDEVGCIRVVARQDAGGRISTEGLDAPGQNRSVSRDRDLACGRDDDTACGRCRRLVDRSNAGTGQMRVDDGTLGRRHIYASSSLVGSIDSITVSRGRVRASLGNDRARKIVDGDISEFHS